MSALILENFLPEAMADEIESVLLSPRLPWAYYPNTNATIATTDPEDSPQFVHGFIQDGRQASQWATIPEAILQRMGLSKDVIIRAKANLLGRELTPLINPKHIDDPQPHYVLIYYVNASDGETVLYKDHKAVQKIRPKKGRAILFDGLIEHASTPPIETRYRCVVNYNLKPDISLEPLQAFQVN